MVSCRYMLLFQHKPEAEEALLGGLTSIFPVPKTQPKNMDDVQQVMSMLHRPGAATSALNWYR